MIKRYSEERLTILVLTVVFIITGVYIAIGAITWGFDSLGNGYGMLPTFAIGVTSANKHVFISLLTFTFASLAEGALLAYLLDKIREIKREFSMLNELYIFSAIWLLFTNFTLFFVI